MKKQTYKIREIAGILVTGIFLIGGTYAILAAPAKQTAADQQQLRNELAENAAILKQQAEASSNIESATAPSLESEATENTDSASEGIVTIGDSVMLGAAPELQEALPSCIVNAKESRQIWDAIDTVQKLNAQAQLGHTVIIGLGSNGSFDKSMGQKLLDAIGSKRTIYWITVYGKNLGWQNDVNQMIARLAEENKNLTVLAWHETASEHPEWFYNDGMHLNETGQAEYAEYIAASL